MPNILIIVSDGQIQTVHASEPDVRTFVLNSDAEGRNLCPHDAAPERWELDVQGDEDAP
jgi:hypothetical protein